jgi:hypothetical protein
MLTEQEKTIIELNGLVGLALGALKAVEITGGQVNQGGVRKVIGMLEEGMQKISDRRAQAVLDHVSDPNG